MIKKELSFTAFDSYGEERERTETVRFLYSLPAIKMYEQRTGRNFFDDNQKALTAYTQLALATGVNGRLSALTDEEKVKLMPLLMEPDFMNFLTEVIPCLYGEVENGRLVQNELTAETASLAPWFGDLIDIGFFQTSFMNLTEVEQRFLKIEKSLNRSHNF
ncbi:hypothetical protein AMCSP20_000279 [Streptococcus pneumoniae 2090008]|uniref:Uncharacterized protein n=3 Tax=root TaxID=1 RepID=A0A1S5SDQ0_9CAUD|nr:hypothetical protein IPP51_00039 [Streptococcus phage IPP51]EHD62749.1 hypothetical protein SPAR70_2578 [Streptococcus pneumoniae GA41410]EHE23419.1 hypothetical protein SPAR71_0048 [Streptococcus pneumoniae GA41437]EHE58091.1 hypothetical protein SPAR104_2349 [Streptococcus pneumoniae GA47751]EJG38669.1 hypothetical protein AMCSP20_000279 [Streptococcus pneumoniae 2090008]